MAPLINNKNVSGRKDGWAVKAVQSSKALVFPGHPTLCKPPDGLPCSCSAQYPLFSFFKINFYWGTVASQCSASFYWISKYISFMYIYPPFWCTFPLWWLQSTELARSQESPISYIGEGSGPLQHSCLKILYIVGCVYMSISTSQFIPLPSS